MSTFYLLQVWCFLALSGFWAPEQTWVGGYLGISLGSWWKTPSTGYPHTALCSERAKWRGAIDNFLLPSLRKLLYFNTLNPSDSFVSLIHSSDQKVVSFGSCVACESPLDHDNSGSCLSIAMKAGIWQKECGSSTVCGDTWDGFLFLLQIYGLHVRASIHPSHSGLNYCTWNGPFVFSTPALSSQIHPGMIQSEISLQETVWLVNWDEGSNRNQLKSQVYLLLASVTWENHFKYLSVFPPL